MRRRLLVSIWVLTMPWAGCNRHGDHDVPAVALAPDVPLPASIETDLQSVGWDERVGDGLGLWVSIARQQLVGIQRGRVRFVFECSTAKRGVGNQANSYQTPTGWHAVDERFGDDLPWGAVFKERKYAGRAWNPSEATTDDLILSRILWLRGLEPGVNSGAGIDSHDRYIYIHGTPEEDRLGAPASMGCIRLSNDDVISLYEQTATGTPVLITEW